MNVKFVREDACLPEILADAQTLVDFRRNIHSEPDLGFDTENTIGKIEKILRDAGIENIDKDTVKSGLIAVVEGTKPGRTIALRADIDALGMPDLTGNPWQSKISGRAHACGHDGHQTWLVGAARYFAKHRDFPGKVVFFFQPAEEIALGATAAVKIGFLEKYGIEEIYGMHTEPNLKAGQFGFRPRFLQASADNFYIVFRGKGGHGGRPHLAVDPIPVGAEFCVAIQTLVARKIDPMNNAVVSICSINAGKFETANVIPNEVKISGTARTFRPQDRDLIEKTIRAKAEALAAAEGMEVEVKYERLIAAVDNDPALTAAGIEIAKSMVGEDSVAPCMDAFMSSEDFSAYQEKIPGMMTRCGIRDDTHQTPLHNSCMDFNDAVLPLASSYLVNVVKSRLNA